MSAKEKFNALIVNLGHPQNLRRRFYAYWDAAPTKFQAVIGFANFFLEIAKRKIKGNTESPEKSELKNSDFFKNSVVKG